MRSTLVLVLGAVASASASSLELRPRSQLAQGGSPVAPPSAVAIAEGPLEGLGVVDSAAVGFGDALDVFEQEQESPLQLDKRAPTCAPTYVDSKIHIRGPGTLPRPTTFVKRSADGKTLTLNGKPWRLVGPNIYWLCNEENIPGQPKGSYTDKSRVREALAIAVAMGANTVRLHTCGISNGFPEALEPGLNQFGGKAQWDIHDYVIAQANRYGLRVVLPLTDNHDYYHGGKSTFLRWLGLSEANGGNAFFTNKAAIDAYKLYITILLRHKNPYTGLYWGADPTIVAVETGNELGGYLGRYGYPPRAWTETISLLMKKWAPNTLVVDGTDGVYNYTTKATAPGLTVPSVDLASRHGYGRDLALLAAEVRTANAAKKPLYLGEFDWQPSGGPNALGEYLAYIERTSTIIGDSVWSVFGHDAQCCNFVTHNDGLSVYYPNGGTADERARTLLIVQHWYRMTGRKAPTTLPSVACPQPA